MNELPAAAVAPFGIEEIAGELAHRVERCLPDDCPVGIAELRYLRVRHVDFKGEDHEGEIVVAAHVAEDVLGIFEDLFEARFPIAGIQLVDRYGCSDDASMAANNTTAFHCRKTKAGSRWSDHALGTAIDVNPVQNPYVRKGQVEPPSGQAFLDRVYVRPGMITRGDEVWQAFARRGFRWGGEWRGQKDYQHFSTSGR